MRMYRDRRHRFPMQRPFNSNFYPWYNHRYHPRWHWAGRRGFGGIFKLALLGSLVWVVAKKSSR